MYQNKGKIVIDQMGHKGHNQRREEAIIEITKVEVQLLRDGGPLCN